MIRKILIGVLALLFLLNIILVVRYVKNRNTTAPPSSEIKFDLETPEGVYANEPNIFKMDWQGEAAIRKLKVDWYVNGKKQNTKEKEELIKQFENTEKASVKLCVYDKCKEVEVFPLLRDTDEDGIPDIEDECIQQAGPEEFKGCPDTDGDGIRDIDDACPREEGSQESKGCPDDDGDGIPNIDDSCPEVYAKTSNGCPKAEEKDSDEDGIIDSEDDCPQIKGSEKHNGCPDTDGDGVPDKDDVCSNVAGLEKFNGCPDTDGDGIEDRYDNCKTEKGTKENNGCPPKAVVKPPIAKPGPDPTPKPKKDRDGDKVLDRDDQCPDQVGLASLNGCPDTDGDGIADKDDACPKVKGESKHKGCPDTDGDGVIDSKDACRTEKGEARYNGCPDSDNDGIPNNKDKCPSEKGTSPDGCPEKVSDRDNDGVADDKDICPDNKGEARYNGCPDSDGDRVPDNKDKCPKEKGTGADGCPKAVDSDGDGIVDTEDECPKIKGDPALKGCSFDDYRFRNYAYFNQISDVEACMNTATNYQNGPFNIKIKPSTPVQLRNCKLISQNNWEATIYLYEGNKRIGEMRNEKVIEGKSEINLSDLSNYLKPGVEYRLEISGSGKLAAINSCSPQKGSSNVASLSQGEHVYNLEIKH